MLGLLAPTPGEVESLLQKGSKMCRNENLEALVCGPLSAVN